MQSYQIRPIKQEDNAIVAKIIRKVMTEFDCVGDGYSINDPEVDHMYEAYDNDQSQFYVIENESTKKVLGCGGISPLKNGDADTCELQKMYFLGELRGKGMGQRLMDICMGEAVHLGFKKCYIETTDRMIQANALYSKNGFQKLCGQVGGTGHCGCDTFYMKELSGNRVFATIDFSKKV